MKTMRKSILYVVIALIAVGCATALEQARTNIQATWRIERVVENGQDVTTEYTATRVNYRIAFDGNNGFVETYQQFSGGDEITISGAWDFSDKATQLILTDNNQQRIYRIDKLDDNEMNLTDKTTTIDRQIEFVPS